MLLFAFVAVPQAFAQAETGSYKDISVDEAYNLIKGAQTGIVVLDVRNQSEYNLGHLYNAILIPVYELEDRIDELQEHTNDPIIVYCKAGSRSQIACEIFASHGFTNVYNMLGGITAWMEAGYPIYTTYHHVTVNVLDEEILLQIEPLLLYQAGCTSCGCQSCGQNQACQNYDITPNITITTLEQNETYTLTLVTYQVNDTAYEVSIAQTLLWSYNEAAHEVNRTGKFISTEITAKSISLQFYSLSYLVQHIEYNLTLYTTLTPLDSETYNSSFTVMNYAPAGKSELASLEFVEFNSSVTLSQHYAVLGKVAKEIGKIYGKSEDENLAQLAEGYYMMEEEAKGLSKLVEKKLSEFDRKVLNSAAVLMDDFWCDLFCHIACYAAFAGAVAACLAGGLVTYGAVWVACSLLLTYGWDYWSYVCDVACYLACGG